MAQGTPSFGIKAGVTSAGMRGDAVNSLRDLLDFSNGAISTTPRLGAFGGAYVSIPLSEQISVEPGIYYAQKGYEVKGALDIKGTEFLNANARAQLTTHYVDVPVLIKANLNGFQVFGGPQVSYLAKADLNTKASVLGFNVFNQNMDATDQFNRWDLGLTGGVGYEFSNGFNISASYDHGLKKVDANQNFESYNQAFKVGVGFRF